MIAAPPIPAPPAGRSPQDALTLADEDNPYATASTTTGPDAGGLLGSAAIGENAGGAAGVPDAGDTPWWEVFAAARYTAIVVRVMNRLVDRGDLAEDSSLWIDNPVVPCLRDLLEEVRR